MATTQVLNPLTQQFAQIDGGELATASLMWQLLVEMRLLNEQLYEQGLGRFISDDLNIRRSELLNDPGFTKQV